MIRTAGAFRLLVVLGLGVLTALPVRAQEGAERLFGDVDRCILIGGGRFTPVSGEGGVFLTGGYFQEPQPNVLIGAEASYSGFRSSIFGVHDVGMTKVVLGGIAKLCLSHNAVRPYVGLTADYSFYGFDKSDLNRNGIAAGLGQGFGVGALAGVIAKFGPRALFFGEVRYGGDWLRTELKGVSTETMNYGGTNIAAGVMLLF